MRAALHRLDEREGLSAGWLFVLFCLTVGLVFSRLPGSLLHAQFYAEDGWIWYQQAYNLGFVRSLLIPQAGYLQTLPRLVTGLLLPVPLEHVPLLMNMAGAMVQALPVVALLGRRCSTWGPLSTRLLMAFVYVAIPNSAEIHLVLTNAMWHLAVLECSMAFAVTPRNARERAADLLLFALGAVSGPFCLLLVVPVAVYWWMRRKRWTLVIGCVLAVGAALQVVFILSKPRAPGVPLGASAGVLLHLLGGNIILDSMVGNFLNGGPRFAVVLQTGLALCLLFGLAVIAWGLRRGPVALRMTALFAGLTLLVSLRDPLTLSAQPRWLALEEVQGSRYWYYPSLLFLWCAVWCLTAGRTRLVRVAGGLALAVLLVWLPQDWRYRSWPDTGFRANAERFHQARVGETVEFPIYPDARRMVLVKH